MLAYPCGPSLSGSICNPRKSGHARGSFFLELEDTMKGSGDSQTNIPRFFTKQLKSGMLFCCLVISQCITVWYNIILENRYWQFWDNKTYDFVYIAL